MEYQDEVPETGSPHGKITMAVALTFFLICLSAAIAADYGSLPMAGTDVMDTSITAPLHTQGALPTIPALPAGGSDVAP